MAVIANTDIKVIGQIESDLFKTPTGTTNQFLKANGDLDNNNYALVSQLFSGNYNDLTNKPDLSILNDVVIKSSLSNFPITGHGDKVYIATDTGYMYRWNGSSYTQLTDQTAIWGQISGNILDQTDLQNALNEKEDNIDKNEAFNKDFGTTADTVAEGNDSRILNGQTAYNWGNHADANYVDTFSNQIIDGEKTLEEYLYLNKGLKIENDPGQYLTISSSDKNHITFNLEQSTSSNLNKMVVFSTFLLDENNLIKYYNLPNKSGTLALTDDLSDENYTTADKNKLANIEAGAEVNVQSDWDATAGDALIKNKPSLNINNWNTAYSWGDHAGLYDNYQGWTLFTNGANRGNISSGESLEFKSGGGISLSYLTSNENTVTFSHADTSTQASSNNSGRTYIQDITLDTYGHVTGLSTATETVINTFLTDLSFNTGDGILTATLNNSSTITEDLDGRYALDSSIGNGTLTLNTSGIATGTSSFSANQSSNSTFTVDVKGTNLTMGGSGDNRTVKSSTGTNVSIPIASTTDAGFLSTGDKGKLDGIESGAEVNAVDSVNTQTGDVVLNADHINDTTTANKFTSQSDIDRLVNTSGTNTGDQDISGISTNASDITDLQNNKVDKVTGKGLSDENYTLSEKDKLAGIEAGAEVNIPETDPTVPDHVKSITTTEKSNWNTAYGWGDHANAGYATGDNFNSSGTYSGLRAQSTTAGDVGLGNVWNADVRDYGIGQTGSNDITNLSQQGLAGGLYSSPTTATGTAIGGSSGAFVNVRTAVSGGAVAQLWMLGNNIMENRAFIRHCNNDGNFTGWDELYHEGNLRSNSENDTRYVEVGGDTMTGDLHIGNKVPTTTSKLDINGSGYDLSTASGHDTGGILLRGGNNTIGSYTSGIGFSMNAGGINAGTAGIAGVQTESSDDRIGLSFFTHPSASSTATSNEVVRILPNGNVGIGTTSPDAKLEVLNNGQTSNLLLSTYDNSNSVNSKLELFRSGGTANSPSTIAVGETIGEIDFKMNTGSGSYTPAKILGSVGNTIGGGNKASGELKFQTDKGDGQGLLTKLIVKNTGNVGIGTNSPQKQLDISSSTGGVLRLSRNDVSTFPEDNIGTIEFYSNDADSPKISSFIKSVARETYGRRGALLFGISKSNNTDAVEVMRINDSGNVGIGDTSPSYKLSVSGTIGATGDVIAYASDDRLKTNKTALDNPLNKIKSLSGFTYNWNDLAKEKADYDTTERLVGVSAQEIQEVLPEAVKLAPFDNKDGKSKSGEDYLTVQYEKLTPLLIEGIKEQQEVIEKQQIQLDSLQEQINELKKLMK